MIFGKKSTFGGGGDEGADASTALNLTALMDILSNLLFFLLASYTAQSVEVDGKAGLKLPSSSSQLALTPEVTITCTTDAIDVSGIPVGRIANGSLVSDLQPDGTLTALRDRLRTVKTSREGAGRADMAESDLVLLLADKGTDSKTISVVLRTAGAAGFVNVRFGVVAR